MYIVSYDVQDRHSDWSDSGVATLDELEDMMVDLLEGTQNVDDYDYWSTEEAAASIRGGLFHRNIPSWIWITDDYSIKVTR